MAGYTVIVLAAGAAAARLLWPGPRPAEEAAPQAAPATRAGAPAEAPRHVHLAHEKWAAAAIAIGSPERRRFGQGLWVTGKVSLNEDRLAHLYPLVEGVVRQVNVKFGQEVEAGEVLAVLDSKEVGAAKLDLVKNRLAVQFTQVNHDWNRTIQQNTQQLIDSLQGSVPLLEIERQFRDQPMGDYRERLVSAYARRNQTHADYERIKGLYEQQISSERDYLKAKTDYDSSVATYQAAIEAIKFAAKQELIASEQNVREATTAESVSRSTLLILGYREEQLAAMDPLAEGQHVSEYLIVSPLNGTVIAKDLVLLEHVAPTMQLFQVADLTAVWIQADIFEKDLHLLHEIERRQRATQTSGGEAPPLPPMRFRAAGYPNREFEARLSYAGDVVDEHTRSVKMVATADNPEGLLKPGMFVELELPNVDEEQVWQVPVAAVQQLDGRTVVFVLTAGNAFEIRDVEVGRKDAAWVEVRSGLHGDERLAIAGGFALKSEILREQLAEE